MDLAEWYRQKASKPTKVTATLPTHLVEQIDGVADVYGVNRSIVIEGMLLAGIAQMGGADAEVQDLPRRDSGKSKPRGEPHLKAVQGDGIKQADTENETPVENSEEVTSEDDSAARKAAQAAARVKSKLAAAGGSPAAEQHDDHDDDDDDEFSDEELDAMSADDFADLDD